MAEISVCSICGSPQPKIGAHNSVTNKTSESTINYRHGRHICLLISWIAYARRRSVRIDSSSSASNGSRRLSPRSRWARAPQGVHSFPLSAPPRKSLSQDAQACSTDNPFPFRFAHSRLALSHNQIDSPQRHPALSLVVTPPPTSYRAYSSSLFLSLSSSRLAPLHSFSRSRNTQPWPNIPFRTFTSSIHHKF